MQKRAIRTISSAARLAHTEPLFDQLKLLTLKNVYILNVLIFMQKYHQGVLPNVFENNMFILNASLHLYNTRQSELYHSPSGRLEIVRRSIRVQGVLLWN